MPPVIRLSDDLYKRLSKHATGFDTPTNVIERLLDHLEGVSLGHSSEKAPERTEKRPELVFQPDEGTFRDGLIRGDAGLVTLSFADGTVTEKTWKSVRFSERSNLRGNIWSGFLRDWQQQGIISAKFSMPKTAEKG